MIPHKNHFLHNVKIGMQISIFDHSIVRFKMFQDNSENQMLQEIKGELLNISESYTRNKQICL